ncbi:TlpA family protein disulfide reductase [Ascidiimonas aurantiaca]|uniref:TlpA family protein disulfide reductase n=1 Tax=Ascidiimonas aurantiaca TaxID=1685432 RepID=UPI0030EE717E
MRYLLLASTIFLMYSCENSSKDVSTYFGGEIVNPNSPYVVLYKNDEVVDSVMLDDNNRFLIELETIDEGLYHFEHVPEMQYVFIEKGDSILFRLNTLDFDESLIFSGKGAEKNNFMIDMFLVNEDEEKLVYDFYDLEAEDFVRKMDSLKQMKIELYDNLVLNFDLSENAKNIAKAGIDYPHYDAKEIYPYIHKNKLHHDEVESLPEHFYAYRNTLNYNDERLSYFGPYVNYLNMYFNNLSYATCMDLCADDKPEANATLHFYLHKLKLINGNIKVKEIRDNLFRNTAFSYLRKDHDASNNEKFIALYEQFSPDNKYGEEINYVFSAIKKLQRGNPIPNVQLVKASGQITNTETLVKGATVYYFWSLNQKNHMANINKKVKKLEQKYPEYTFVGININEDHDTWVNILERMGLDTAKQFRSKSFEEIREKLVIEGLNKVIIVNPDGTIVNAFGNINEADFMDNVKSL